MSVSKVNFILGEISVRDYMEYDKQMKQAVDYLEGLKEFNNFFDSYLDKKYGNQLFVNIEDIKIKNFKNIVRAVEDNTYKLKYNPYDLNKLKDDIRLSNSNNTEVYTNYLNNVSRVIKDKKLRLVELKEDNLNIYNILKDLKDDFKVDPIPVLQKSNEDKIYSIQNYLDNVKDIGFDEFNEIGKKMKQALVNSMKVHYQTYLELFKKERYYINLIRHAHNLSKDKTRLKKQKYYKCVKKVCDDVSRRE